MADLTDIQAAQSVKIVGVDASGLETNPLNVDANGAAEATLRDPTSGAGVTTTLVGAKRSLDVNVTATQPLSDNIGTGTIAALNATVEANTQGCGTVNFQVTGTWVATLTIEGTTDGSTWITITGQDRQTRLALTTTTLNRTISANCAAFQKVRLRASLYTSGTAGIAHDAASGDYNSVEATIGNIAATPPQQAQYVGGLDLNNNIMRPLQVDDQGRLVTSAITGFGADFVFGNVSTASTATAIVRRTAYIEQVSDAQRSIVSANANDTAAGTGARSVRITYLTASGAGPFTETVTLNGTTAVNTVATNICFIEELVVVTVGSTSSNVGIISLRAATAGGGATIGTIAATDNRTFWSHHYIPTGKICNITGVSVSHNGTTVGSGAVFVIRAISLPIANQAEAQVSDFVRLYGQASTSTRNYGSPIKVSGPARLISYVTPETSTAVVYRSSIDFFEP